MSITKLALVGCATFIVAGCATQQNVTPQYRLSTSSVKSVEGASMLQRGRAQLDAGLDALAIESFRADIRFNPDQLDAYNGLAVAYGRMGRNDLAQRYFEIALAKDPMNAKVQSNIAKLPGNGRFATMQATALPTATSHDPVAVTVETANHGEFQTTIRFDVPQLADAQMLSKERSDEPLLEILGKRGVLTTRVAVASTRLTLDHAGSTTGQSMAFPEPKKRPVPAPERQLPYLQSEIRIAARVERVSLNEVRLITQLVDTPPRARSAQSFGSFGDRLALWLPAYISTERVASGHKANENIVVMAVAEDVGANDKPDFGSIALADESAAAAYIPFGDSNGVIGT